MHGGPEVSEDRVRDARKRCPGGYVDVTMLLALGMILIFGLAMIYSTSSYRAYDLYGDQMYFFKRQALYMLLAILAMYIVSRYDYRRLLRLSAVILLSSLVLQVGFQPSEYAKTAIIIYTSARAAVESKNLCRPGCLIKVMILPVITIALIGVENLSTAIICFAILFVILFVGSPRVRHFVLIGIFGVVGSVLFIMFAGYRANRVKIWLDPENYADGYQTVQSLYAVGSGGLFGVGFGRSVQKMGFIPESHNDMIFSVVCEELGIVGAAFILIIFLILLRRMAVTAMNARDRFGSMLTAGVMAHVAVQLLINVSVVTNTIPPTGVPMPFVSYGGSSIIFILMEMGIVMSVSRGISYDETDI